MGADYYIRCKCCDTKVSHFYITRNYNTVFPFWLLHNHIEGCYEDDKREANIKEEYEFLLKTVRNTLEYYAGGPIYNYITWSKKAERYQKGHNIRDSMKGYETTKYTVIMALIRFYWHLKRYPFDKYKWICWY